MPIPSLPSPPTIFPTYLLPSIPFRRRRTSSTSTSTTSPSTSPPNAPIGTSPSTTTTTHSRRRSSYLKGHTSHLRCSRCLTDLCLSSQIISKGFTGRHGRAYLVSPFPPTSYPSSPFSPTGTLPAPPVDASAASTLPQNATPNLPNTHVRKPVPRQLVTGAHTVADITCALCGSELGWKYVAAAEVSQAYKVGKFILETKRVVGGVSWEGDDDDDVVVVQEEELGRVVDKVGRGGGGKGKGGEGIEEAVEFDSQDEDECEDLFMGTWTVDGARERRKSKRF